MKSTLETTKVFVPTENESNMCLSLWHVGNGDWVPSTNLAEKEAIVLAPEQLESLMLGFADFIERKSIWGTGTGWKEHSSNEQYQLYLKEEKTKP